MTADRTSATPAGKLILGVAALVHGCAIMPQLPDKPDELAHEPASTPRVVVRSVPPGDCLGAYSSYTLKEQRYWIRRVRAGHVETGMASWYGPGFHARKTASGEIFDMNQVSAAHKTLPLFSVVRVVNLNNNKEVTVRINDRGPFVGGRLIDLSYAAAQKIGMIDAGVVPVRVTVAKVPPKREPRTVAFGTRREE